MKFELGKAVFMFIACGISIGVFVWLVSHSEDQTLTKAGTGNTVNVINEFEE